MEAERTIQFEGEDIRVVDNDEWRSIYFRLARLRPEDRGPKQITMTSRTRSHSSDNKMVNRTFDVSERVFKNIKITVGNFERRTKPPTKRK
jgi:hypothetical protein